MSESAEITTNNARTNQTTSLSNSHEISSSCVNSNNALADVNKIKNNFDFKRPDIDNNQFNDAPTNKFFTSEFSNNEAKSKIDTESKIENIYKKLLEHMDEKDKLILLQFISIPETIENIENIFNDKEEDNYVNSLPELTRLLIILFALFALLIFNQDLEKTTFSGKDLNLPFDPPEGKEIEQIAKNRFPGENQDKSWARFIEQVNKLENLPFGEFMSAVLMANEKNVVRNIFMNKENKGTKFKTKKFLLNLFNKFTPGSKLQQFPLTTANPTKAV